jgi:hypothetical protein
MRRRHPLFVVVLVAGSVTAACTSVQSSAATPHLSTASFVYAHGTQLYLNGKPYHFKGLNIFNANARSGCRYSMQDPVLATSLGQIGTGENVFRAWFSQDEVYRKATSNADWSAFDQTLRDAAQFHERVIVTLGNQWGDCDQPSGQYKDITFYQSGYTSLLLPRETYRAWVRDVVTRYRYNATVLMFQLMDEPEAGTGWANGHTTTCDESAAASALQQWATDMASLVKSIDHNHLLDVGSLGGGQCGMSGNDYKLVHAVAGIDVCEYHDYHDADNPMPGDQWNGLAVRLQQCGVKGVNKPLFVGETGIARSEAVSYQAGTSYGGDSGVGADACAESSEGQDGCPAIDSQTCPSAQQLNCRATDFQQKFTMQFNAGVVGELAWDWCYAPSQTCNSAGYDVLANDPLLTLLTKA